MDLKIQKAKATINNGRLLIVFTALPIIGSLIKFFYIKEEITASKDNTSKTLKPEMNIEEIYNEFWEFIDDEIPEFKHLIEKDPRRKQLSNDQEY